MLIFTYPTSCLVQRSFCSSSNWAVFLCYIKQSRFSPFRPTNLNFIIYIPFYFQIILYYMSRIFKSCDLWKNMTSKLKTIIILLNLHFIYFILRLCRRHAFSRLVAISPITHLNSTSTFQVGLYRRQTKHFSASS